MRLPYQPIAPHSAGQKRFTQDVRSFFLFLFSSHFYFPASGQTVVTGVARSPLRPFPSIFISHRVQQSHFSSIFHRVLLTHALALSASHFVHTKKSQRIYTSMHSGGFELTKLTYTRLRDNLIRHRGEWLEIKDIHERGSFVSSCLIAFFCIRRLFISLSRSPVIFTIMLVYYSTVFWC